MRHVGERIIQACEALEDGPCGCAELGIRINVPTPNASKYLLRAVDYGLATVQKPEGRGRNGHFGIYSVLPGWRELIKKKPKLPTIETKPRQRKRRKTIFSYANSVFNLGV